METGGSLDKRGRALEDEFFYRVDKRLAEQLRQQMEKDARKAAMKTQCAWASDELLDELVSVGMTVESLVALSLVPLVRVAWADHSVADAERDAILKAAAENHCPADSLGHELLKSWLHEAPPASLFDTWKHYIVALFASLSPGTQQEVRKRVLQQTRRVAEAAGGFLGIHKISADEERVLEEVEAVLSSST